MQCCRALARSSCQYVDGRTRLEAKFATAGEASLLDLEAYGRASNTLRRLLEAVGLQRRPKDTTLIDAEAEAIGHAERMEKRRAYLDRRSAELAEQVAAGVTVIYPDR